MSKTNFRWVGLVVSIFIIIHKPSFSQPLNIGDNLSSLVLKNVQNYISDSLQIGDLRGKVIILDFWNAACAPCIAYMPSMEKFQETFKEQIQVVLVSTDTKERINSVSEKNEIVRKINLPSMINDRELTKRFPFRTLPSHVWIGPDGTIRYISDGSYTTEKNIRLFLEGKDLQLPLKSQIKDLDYSKPLWLEGNGRHIDKLQFYSYLMSYINDGSSRYGILKERDTRTVNRIKLQNQPVLTMLKMAYGEGMETKNPFWYDNRVVLKVKDSTQYIAPTDPQELTSWMQRHTYCYELKVPPAQSLQLFQIMRHELETYFNIKGTVKEIEKECYALVLKDSSLLCIKNDSPPAFYETVANSKRIIHINNLPVDYLLAELMIYNESSKVPLISLLPVLEHVRIDWETGLKDPEQWNQALEKIGIGIVKMKRKVPMLVLQDRF